MTSRMSLLMSACSFSFKLHVFTFSAHLEKKMLPLTSIWGPCSLHLRSTDGSIGSAGWNSSKLDLLRGCFSFCYDSVLSFHSALRVNVVFILARKTSTLDFLSPHYHTRCYCVEISSLSCDDKLLSLKINTWAWISVILSACQKSLALHSTACRSHSEVWVSCFRSVTADENTTWNEWTREVEGVLFLQQQRGDKGMTFSSASGSSDSRGPLAWPSSISPAVPSCGAYQLHQRASTVSQSKGQKYFWLWCQFVFLNREK